VIRRRRGPAPLTNELVRALLPQWVPLTGHLDGEQRARLVEDTVLVADGLRWEAAKGFELTDAMRVAVAGHAALLSLELPGGAGSWSHVSSIIVHPNQMRRRGSRPSHFEGVYTDDDSVIIGEAHDKGPVLVSWSAVRRQVLFQQRSGSVLLHEFAHQLDLLDGSFDGTPVLASESERQRWIDVCTNVYERMQADPHPVIDRYGATNPSEFFAVAVETVFVRPQSLLDTEPALFAVLTDFLGQRPSS
jgi:MtfA peptidase